MTAFALRLFLALVLSLLLSPCQAEDEPRKLPFFVLDNGLTDIKAPAEQASLLHRLGYDGICIRTGKDSDEFLAAFDQKDLKIWASYVTLAAEPELGIPPKIREHIEALKGRGTVIWLGITNRDARPEDAIRISKEICDLAASHGLTVALYPHTGFYTDTLRNCIALRQAVGHENLGLGFTLCHFLMQTDASELEALLTAAAPHLKLVQINGADAVPPGTAKWDRLIQPLGNGDFDIAKLFRLLDRLDYTGPIGLQCYKVPGPAETHLAQSMKAWKKLCAGRTKVIDQPEPTVR